jgi:hypothetical protein
LQVAQEKRLEKQAQVNQKKRFLSDLPNFFNSLEEATLPLQDYLQVKPTKEKENLQIVQRLPLPLATLFEKLTFFAAV